MAWGSSLLGALGPEGAPDLRAPLSRTSQDYWVAEIPFSVIAVLIVLKPELVCLPNVATVFNCCSAVFVFCECAGENLKRFACNSHFILFQCVGPGVTLMRLKLTR
jgi:hypothetical protein